MRKLLILAFVVILLVGSSCSTLFNNLSGYSPIEGTEGKMLERYDEYQQVRWINHQYFNTASFEPFRLYIGEENGEYWLRGVLKYGGSDWIFFDEAILIDSKGNKISWNIKSYDKNTEVISGSYVTEIYDFLITDTDAFSLYNLLEDGTLKIRLTGKKYKDYSINTNRITALKEILEYYYDMRT